MVPEKEDVLLGAQSSVTLYPETRVCSEVGENLFTMKEFDYYHNDQFDIIDSEGHNYTENGEKNKEKDPMNWCPDGEGDGVGYNPKAPNPTPAWHGRDNHDREQVSYYAQQSSISLCPATADAKPFMDPGGEVDSLTSGESGERESKEETEGAGYNPQAPDVTTQTSCTEKLSRTGEA